MVVSDGIAPVVVKPAKRAAKAVAAAPAAEKAAQAEGLNGRKRWRVAVSYFETGKRDGQPLYVLSFDLYENGVSRALALDYGDFVLKGDMKELTLQPAANCKK